LNSVIFPFLAVGAFFWALVDKRVKRTDTRREPLSGIIRNITKEKENRKATAAFVLLATNFDAPFGNTRGLLGGYGRLGHLDLSRHLDAKSGGC
jgi:hypothetical protein